MKVLLLAALVAGSIPAYAATDYDQAPQTAAAQEAVDEGLIPADQLDATEFQTEALPPGGRPGPGPGRPGPGRPGHPPGHRPPAPPRFERWQCVARDRIQRSYRGDDRNLNDARREAVRSCERSTRAGGCRLVGCSRH